MRTVVFIGATYCPQCRRMEADILRLKKRFPKRVTIIQANKEYASAAKFKPDIDHVPVMLLFDNETKEEKMLTYDELVEWFHDDKN